MVTRWKRATEILRTNRESALKPESFRFCTRDHALRPWTVPKAKVASSMLAGGATVSLEQRKTTAFVAIGGRKRSSISPSLPTALHDTFVFEVANIGRVLLYAFASPVHRAQNAHRLTPITMTRIGVDSLQ